MNGRRLSEDNLIQLSLLREEETDELVAAGYIREDWRWISPLDRKMVYNCREVSISISPGREYPVASPKWEVINLSMPINPIDALRRRLREIVEGAADTNTVERFLAWVDGSGGITFDYVKVVTLMLEQTRAAIDDFREERASKLPVKKADQLDPLPPGFNFKLKDAVGIDTQSSSELAYRYIGHTPQQIAALIPAGYRVQHLEEVIRKDLSRKFDACEENFRETLSLLSLRELRQFAPPTLCHSTRTADYVDQIARPRLTFHGTQRRFVPNIVRNGFLRPGMKDPSTGADHGVRCGSTYGRGIYSSPDLPFSLAYSDSTGTATRPDEYYGLKIIVCATLMGRSRGIYRDDNWRMQSHPYEGADSHVGNGNLEYIVFKTEQILPVYVIHLDWGEHNADFFQDIPEDPSQWVQRRSHPKLDQEIQYAGDKQRAKAATIARVAKYLPFGFGPATGTKFQVEEVGEVSEDEEDYGYYQELRGEKNHDVDVSYWSWQKMGEIEDTRQAANSAHEYGKLKRTYGPNWEDIPLPEQEKIPEEDVDEHDDGFCLRQLMDVLEEEA